MRSFSRLRLHRLRNGSFTLLEVLITLAILLVILVVVMQFMAAVDPVSYTHLDVYKRQVYLCRSL